MQLSCNTITPIFKALLVTPNGYKAIEGAGMQQYVNKLINTCAKHEYVDGVITGEPDEYGDYHQPIMKVIDKVTGERLRGDFEIDTPHGEFGYSEIKTEDGKLIPENVAVLKDSKGNIRYFSFSDFTDAERFVGCAKGNKHYRSYHYRSYIFGILEAMEDYYKYIFNNKDGVRDQYVDLMQLMKKTYKKPLDKIIPEIMTEENLLGRGREKDVYKIKELPTYALCIIRDKYDPNKQISPFRQCFQTDSVTDYDSPIVMNDNGMYIKKCVDGKSHSIPGFVRKILKNEPLIYDDIKYFMQSLKELSEFPTKSFVDFAKSLQKLNKERLRIDTINPNNVIIDSAKKSISIIDVSPKNRELLSGMIRPINGLSDMEALLCDSLGYMKYYDMATDEGKKLLDEYAKIIIEKCRIAAQVTNLGNFPHNTEQYLKYVEGRKESRRGQLLPKLRAFREHFKGILSEVIVSTEFRNLPAYVHYLK